MSPRALRQPLQQDHGPLSGPQTVSSACQVTTGWEKELFRFVWFGFAVLKESKTNRSQNFCFDILTYMHGTGVLRNSFIQESVEKKFQKGPLFTMQKERSAAFEKVQFEVLYQPGENIFVI